MTPRLPRPDGYHPVGADRQMLPDGTAGVVVYASDAPTASDPLMLFLQPGGPAVTAAPPRRDTSACGAAAAST